MTNSKEIADKYDVDVEDVEFYYDFFVLASGDTNWDSYENFIADKLLDNLKDLRENRAKRKRIRRNLFYTENFIYFVILVLLAAVSIKLI